MCRALQAVLEYNHTEISSDLSFIKIAKSGTSVLIPRNRTCLMQAFAQPLSFLFELTLGQNARKKKQVLRSLSHASLDNTGVCGALLQRTRTLIFTSIAYVFPIYAVYRILSVNTEAFIAIEPCNKVIMTYKYFFSTLVLD